MFKKMMLLAVSAAALVAFAVPAAAQANLTWSEAGTIEGSGELTSTSQTGLVTGPAPVSFTAEVEGSAGEVTSFVINEGKGGIPTNVPGCTAQGTTAALNWGASLATPDTMTIEDVTFVNHYTGASCAVAGVPPSVPVAGDVTLTVTSGNSADANPFNDNGVLKVEGTQIGVDITGQVSWTGPSIEGL
jgi:hypothetical protein